MAQSAIGSQTSSHPAKVTSATKYAPISAKVPAALTAAGGIFAVVGGLGIWIRATAGVPGKAPEQISAVWGHSAGGLLVAALGLVALGSSVAWTRRELFWRMLPFLMGFAVALETALRLSDLDKSVRAMILVTAETVKETAETGVTNYHVGFGWGAWFLVAASVILVLGSIAGALRELDLRGRTSE